MTLLDDNTRSSVALQLITALTHEKQALMAQVWRAPLHERPPIQRRLRQIEVELAFAEEERRRARAGAPPAPLGYDPQGPMPRADSEGKNTPRSRTWKQKVEAIKADYQDGHGLEKHALAEKYGMSAQQIRRVLGEDVEHSHPTAKLAEAQVRDILRRYQESNGRRGIIKELADVYQVRKSTICDIVARRTWRNIEVDFVLPRKRTAGKTRQASAQPAATGEA